MRNLKTLCELIEGQMQSHLFNAKARNHSSMPGKSATIQKISNTQYTIPSSVLEENIYLSPGI